MSFSRPLIVALIALAPGAVAWWTGRRLGTTPDDPALPELLLARNQRVVPVIAGALAVMMVFGGGHFYWGIATVALGMVVGSFPLRRALGIETVGLSRYLWRSIRSIVGSVGFWILLAWTPQILFAIDPEYRLAGLLLLPVLFLWELWYPRLWLALHDSVPLVDEALAPRVASILERAGMAAPALYRIGAPDARFINAFAFPSAHQPAIGLGNTLIELLEPDEAAAIYAHELAHIEHFSPRRIRRLQLVNRALILLAVALPFLRRHMSPGSRPGSRLSGRSSSSPR